MLNKIYAKMDELMPELLKSIQRLVAIESVEGVHTEDAPYGEMPKKALLEVLSIAEELGFHTKNMDNIIGYAQYGGGDGDYIGIFGHVDVVPVGEGWSYPPLGGVIDRGRIWGRGVLDNKGPILTNLYALYALKELGVTFNRPVRVVFGTNEESGFGCVKHYLTKENPPVFGWTPDCKWPVVYGERGRALIQFVNHGSQEDFNEFINEYILSSPKNGVKLGINVKDEDFGEMIMRGYKLGMTDDNLFFQISLSYPKVKTVDELVEMIREVTPESIEVICVHNWNPVFYDKESPEITLLTDAYEEVMGERLAPVTTTGGTYAKIIPNTIAFGPSFPAQKDIAHLPDEWMNLDDILNNAKIYSNALYKLKDL